MADGRVAEERGEGRAPAAGWPAAASTKRLLGGPPGRRVRPPIPLALPLAPCPDGPLSVKRNDRATAE